MELRSNKTILIWQKEKIINQSKQIETLKGDNEELREKLNCYSVVYCEQIEEENTKLKEQLKEKKDRITELAIALQNK